MYGMQFSYPSIFYFKEDNEMVSIKVSIKVTDCYDNFLCLVSPFHMYGVGYSTKILKW